MRATDDWRTRLETLRDAEASGRLPDRWTLLRALEDPCAYVRRAAARLLGRSRDSTVVDSLLARAADRDKDVRSAARTAARTLAESNARVVARLHESFADSDPAVRGLAAFAWPRSEPVGPLADAVSDDAELVRWAATHALASRNLEFTTIANPDAIAYGRPARLEEVERRDPETIEPLLRAAQDESSAVRVVAVRGLWSVSLDEAIAGLERALGDPNRNVRRAAAVGLRDRCDVRVLGPLRRALRDSDPWVRRWALIGIAGADRAAGLDAAIELLRDRNRSVRISAAGRLGDAREARATGPLVDLLSRSTSAWVRAAAASALGEIGDAWAVPALAAALSDPTFEPRSGGPPYYRVRDRAEQALRAIGTFEARLALREASAPESPG